KDNSLGNKIKTTLLMTGGGIAKEEVAAPVVAPIIPVVKEKVVLEKPAVVIDKPAKPVVVKKKKVVKKVKKPAPAEKVPFIEPLPVFDNVAFEHKLAELGAKKLNVVEASVRPNPQNQLGQRKAIRRSALDVKKAEEL